MSPRHDLLEQIEKIDKCCILLELRMNLEGVPPTEGVVFARKNLACDLADHIQQRVAEEVVGTELGVLLKFEISA